MVRSRSHIRPVLVAALLLAVAALCLVCGCDRLSQATEPDNAAISADEPASTDGEGASEGSDALEQTDFATGEENADAVTDSSDGQDAQTPADSTSVADGQDAEAIDSNNPEGDGVKGDASASSEANGDPSLVSQVSTDGLLDSNKHLTIDAVASLNGKELDAVLAVAGYKYVNSQLGWVFSETDSFGAVRPVGGEGNGYVGMTQRELSALSSLNSDAVYVFNISGYASAKEAMKGACNLVVEDIAYPDAKSVVAVVSNEAGDRFWVSGATDGAVTRLIVASDAGVSCGLLSQLVGIDLGMSVTEAWQKATGVDVGEMKAALGTGLDDETAADDVAAEDGSTDEAAGSAAESGSQEAIGMGTDVALDSASSTEPTES